MNRRFAFLQVLISVVALAAVVWWAVGQDSPELPSTGGAVAWLAGAAALYVLVTVMRGERWHQILHLTDVDAQRVDSYALTTVGYMGNNVLPARAGEVLKVVLMSNRTDAGKREVLGTVVAERALDAIALGSIFMVVVYGILQETTLPSDRPLLVGGIAVVALIAGVIALQVLRRRGALQRLIDFLRPLADAPRALLARPRQGFLLLAGTFLIWGVEASVYLAIAHSVDLGISGMGALYLVALTNLFAMLPAAPGYVGTFDAAVIFGVKAIGGTSSAAFSYLILLRFVLFVPITIVGLVLLVTRYGGWARLRDATRRVEASQA